MTATEAAAETNLKLALRQHAQSCKLGFEPACEDVARIEALDKPKPPAPP